MSRSIFLWWYANYGYWLDSLIDLIGWIVGALFYSAFFVPLNVTKWNFPSHLFSDSELKHNV